MRCKIQQSVTRQHLLYIFDCPIAQNILQNLKKRFYPIEELQNRELIVQYNHFAKDEFKGTKIEGQLLGFKKIYKDCVKAKLSKVEGNCTIKDFLV